MSELEPRAPWDRADGESEAQHAWLHAYLQLGSDRTPSKAARRCGVPVKLVKEAASTWGWARRAADYDAAVIDVSRAIVMDEKEALATQYAVGHIMLSLGARALELKNPALMNMATIQALLREGSELVRRGAGVADMKITHETVQNIEGAFNRLLGGKSDD